MLCRRLTYCLAAAAAAAPTNPLSMQLPGIPLDFASPAQYSRFLLSYVVEEVMAQLRQGLQDADFRGSDSPPVSNIQKPRGLFADSGDAHDLDMYEVSATLSCSFYSAANGSKLRTHLKPADVVLLHSGRYGKQPSCRMLAFVTSVPAQYHLAQLMKEAAAAGRNSVELPVTVKVFTEEQSGEHAGLFSDSSSRRWSARVVGGLITYARVFSALQQLASKPLHSSKLLQELLLHTPPPAAAAAAEGTADSSTPAAAAVDADPDADPHLAAQMYSAVRSYCQMKPALDASQEAVVMRTTCAPAAEQRQAATLVQGPPGTGKTATLARATSILACSGKRVLTCAPTSAAVSESAQRSLQLIADGRQFAQCAGSGSSLQMRPLSTGDMLLAGNEEKVDLSGPVAAVHLKLRVKRLMKIAGSSGLLGTFKEASALLNIKLLFDFKQQPAASCSTPAAAFAAFLASRVVAVQQQLQAQMQVVTQDMPSDSVAGLQESVQQLLSWLQVLLDCARDEQASSSGSSHSGSSDTSSDSSSSNSSSSDTSSSSNDSSIGSDTSSGSLFDEFTALKATKGSSVAFGSSAVEAELLAAPAGLSRWEVAAVQLRAAIQQAEEQVPDVLRKAPSHRELQEFCVSSCRHVFCTVATAGAPYMSAMGGFSVVVLDEAAQVSSFEDLRCCVSHMLLWCC
jgi:hypothetical protein